MNMCAWSPFFMIGEEIKLLCGVESITPCDFLVTKPNLCALFSCCILFHGSLYVISHSADSAHSNGDMDAPTSASYSASHVRLSDGATKRGGFPSARWRHALHCQSRRPKFKHPQCSQLWFSKYEHTFPCCSDCSPLLELPLAMPRVIGHW